MKRQLIIAIDILFLLIGFSCSKKHLPQKNENPTVSHVTKPKVIHTPVPKVISVNDSVATRSIDGRLYYDLLHHRYWRNYKNGKYYLFNKSMYTNPAFKPK